MSPATETLTRITEWVHSNFPLARERSVGPDDSLLDSGIVDSLGTLDIVMFLESEFGLVIDENDMVADHFETIRSIADLVSSKVSNEQAPR